MILETIKQRLRASLLTPALPEEMIRRAAQLAAGVQPDGAWADLAGVDPFAERSGGMLEHLQRTLFIALANRSDGAMDDPLRRALDFWLVHDFQAPAWQQNQLIVPRLVGSIALLMDDDLSPGALGKVTEILARSRWQHWVTGTGWTDWRGITLLQIAHNALLRGCVSGIDREFEDAFGRVFRAIRVAPEGEEGIQPDMIYRAAAGPPSADHEGLDYATDCLRLVALAHGTPWQSPAESVGVLAAFLLDGQQWLMRNGVMAPNAPESSPTCVPANLTLLATAVERLADFGDIPRRSEMADLARRLMGKGEMLAGHRHFWRSGFSVHQRPAYYTSVRLTSAEGEACIMRSGGEYEGVPVAAGDTPADTTPPFSGGVSEGDYGLAAAQTEVPGYRASKAWCYFDHSFVCLGAGISATGSNQPVFTTINHCRLNGPVTAVADLAKPRVLAPGSEHALPATRRIVHDGITYHFARPSRVAAQAGTPRGTATDATSAPLEQFSLRINHGLHPHDESYAYIVLPLGEDAAAKTRIEEEVAQIEILSNTPAIQAVRHRGLGLVGAAFWQAGMVTLPGGGRIAANQPCVLLCRDTKTGRRLSIANVRMHATTVHVEYAGKSLCFDLPGGPDAGRGIHRSL